MCQQLFRTVADLLLVSGRLCLQTTAVGKNKVKDPEFDHRATRDSIPLLPAVMDWPFPGSRLPFESKQIEKSAQPIYRTVVKNSGRVDCIQTIRQRGRRYRRFDFQK